jgi:hypothetical protein
MKKTLFFLISLALFSISSCNLIDDIKEDDNELNGDTDIPLGEVGNTFATTTYINGNYVESETSISITRNDDGLVRMAVVADLTKFPALAGYNNMIPDTYKDSQGRLNTEAKYKITSEGIQDFTNIDQEPHTMVKYDGKVGDTYKLEKSDGNTITRTVTAKSSEDDFPYGFMYIKTMTVEQDSRIPGINKIVYRFNHKFGLVYAEIVAEDGSTAGSYFYPSNY